MQFCTGFIFYTFHTSETILYEDTILRSQLFFTYSQLMRGSRKFRQGPYFFFFFFLLLFFFFWGGGGVGGSHQRISKMAVRTSLEKQSGPFGQIASRWEARTRIRLTYSHFCESPGGGVWTPLSHLWIRECSYIAKRLVHL